MPLELSRELFQADEKLVTYIKGLTLLYTLEMKKSLIIDIGGGSVEFIIGNGGRDFLETKFEIGAHGYSSDFKNMIPFFQRKLMSSIFYFSGTTCPALEAIRIITNNLAVLPEP